MKTENTIWRTMDGRTIKLKNLEDTHLSNIIHFLTHRHNSYTYEILEILKRIAKNRGLSSEFLNRSQIPYKNINNKWEIWNGSSLTEIQK